MITHGKSLQFQENTCGTFAIVKFFANLVKGVWEIMFILVFVNELI